MVAVPDESRVLLAADRPEERRRLLAELFTHHGKRLLAMVEMRLDHRLRGQLDPSDILKAALADATSGLDGYLRSPRVPLFLWLHSLVAAKLREVHRQHLDVHRRENRKEVCLGFSVLPEASPEVLAERLSGKRVPAVDGPDAQTERLRRALERMDILDREVLALKGVERLTNAETALVLGVHSGAAGQRYARALRRLRELFGESN